MLSIYQKINLVFSVLNVFAQLFIWCAFFVFAGIMEAIDRHHKVKSGRELMFIVLPLLLIQPIVGGYFFFKTLTFPPPDISLLTFAVLSTAYLFVFLTILHFKNQLKFSIKHKYMFYVYILLFLAVSIYTSKNLTKFYLIPQVFYIFGELFLGISLLIIFEYIKHNFTKVKIIPELLTVSVVMAFLLPALRAYQIGITGNAGLAVIVRSVNLSINFIRGALMLIGVIMFRNKIFAFYLSRKRDLRK